MKISELVNKLQIFDRNDEVQFRVKIDGLFYDAEYLNLVYEKSIITFYTECNIPKKNYED